MEITYNGLELTSVETSGYRSETLYDESGLIPRGIRYTMDFTALVHASTGTSSLSVPLHDVQRVLSEPRKTLLLEIAPDVHWDIRGAYTTGSPPSGTNVHEDIDGGPRFTNLNVTQIVGSRSATVAGQVMFTVQPYMDSESYPHNANILSHRYQQRFNINETDYTTRTVRGELRLRGASYINPDEFRCHVWPNVAPGLKRISAEFIVTEDGTGLIYQVVDEERFKPYPAGVSYAEGSYDVLVSAGATAIKRIMVRVVGTKFQPHNDLIKAAHDAVKLRIGGDAVRSYRMRENIWGENSLTLEAETVGSTIQNVTSVSYAGLKLFAAVPNPSTLESRGRFRPINAYGSALVQATVQAFYDVSDDPVNAAAFSAHRASVTLLDRNDLSDVDQDGFAEAFCAEDPVEAVEIPEMPDEDETNSIIGFGDPNAVLTAEGQITGNTPYTMVRTTATRTIHNQFVRLVTADPDASDEEIQIAKPYIMETHRGSLSRVNAAPELPVPEQFSSLTGRTGALVGYNANISSPVPLPGGFNTEQSATFDFTVRRFYDPAADDWVSDHQIKQDGAASAVRTVGYRGTSADTMPVPYQPQIRADSNIPTSPIQPWLPPGETQTEIAGLA